MGGARVPRAGGTRQRCLSDLPGSQYGHHRKLLQPLQNLLAMCVSLDHRCPSDSENSKYVFDISGFTDGM